MLGLSQTSPIHIGSSNSGKAPFQPDEMFIDVVVDSMDITSPGSAALATVRQANTKKRDTCRNWQCRGDKCFHLHEDEVSHDIHL